MPVGGYGTSVATHMTQGTSGAAVQSDQQVQQMSQLLEASNMLASSSDGSAAFLERYRCGSQATGAASMSAAAAAVQRPAGKGAALTDKNGNLI